MFCIRDKSEKTEGGRKERGYFDVVHMVIFPCVSWGGPLSSSLHNLGRFGCVVG